MSYSAAEKWKKIGKVGADDKGSADVLSCYRPKLDLTAGSRLEVIENSRFEAALCLQYDEKEGSKWQRREQGGSLGEGVQRLRNAFQMAAVSCYMMVLFAQPAAAADTMWTRFSTIIADVYGELVGISTIVAVTAAAVALLVRMISRNERAVAEATSWLKRIVVTWIVLNTLGFVVAYLQPLIQGGQYTPVDYSLIPERAKSNLRRICQ